MVPGRSAMLRAEPFRSSDGIVLYRLTTGRAHPIQNSHHRPELSRRILFHPFHGRLDRKPRFFIASICPSLFPHWQHRPFCLVILRLKQRTAFPYKIKKIYEKNAYLYKNSTGPAKNADIPMLIPVSYLCFDFSDNPCHRDYILQAPLL